MAFGIRSYYLVSGTRGDSTDVRTILNETGYEVSYKGAPVIRCEFANYNVEINNYGETNVSIVSLINRFFYLVDAPYYAFSSILESTPTGDVPGLRKRKSRVLFIKNQETGLEKAMFSGKCHMRLTGASVGKLYKQLLLEARDRWELESILRTTNRPRVAEVPRATVTAMAPPLPDDRFVTTPIF